MHRSTFIRRGMTRRPVRNALLITSIAIAFFIYLVLTSFERGFLGGEVESERLVVSNKIGDALPLPISYYDKILALPGIASATYMARSRATYRTPSNFLGLTAVEPDSFPAFIGDEYDISAETLARFRQTRNGVIAGRSIATQEGWVVGQKITLNTSSFFRADGSSDFEFEIAGILDGRKSADTHFVMARYDYMNSERGVDRDTVSNFGVLPRSGAHADDVIKAVDTLFANSAYQTRTRTEAEFMRDFIAQYAYPLPVRVIGELFGVPEEGRPLLSKWSKHISTFFEVGPAKVEALENMTSSVQEMTDYLREVVEKNRQDPQDNILGNLIRAEEEGAVLSEDQLLATCVMVRFTLKNCSPRAANCWLNTVATWMGNLRCCSQVARTRRCNSCWRICRLAVPSM